MHEWGGCDNLIQLTRLVIHWLCDRSSDRSLSLASCCNNYETKYNYKIVSNFNFNFNFHNKYIYKITWLQCAFSLVVASDRLEDTCTVDIKSTSADNWADLFLSFSTPQTTINHLNFYCIKQIDNIFLCVCTVIDHRRRHSV